MTANIHAIMLLAMIIGTGVILLKCRRKFDAKNLSTALLGSGYLLVVFLASAHMCNSGSPVHQFLASLACLVPISILVEHRILRRSVVTLVLVLSTFLSYDFVQLVHTQSYTATPGWTIVKGSYSDGPNDTWFKSDKQMWYTWLTGLYENQAPESCVPSTPSKSVQAPCAIVTNAGER